MEIKRRADSAPEKDRQHDGQIRKLEAVKETDDTQNLQSDEGGKDYQLNLFVLKHPAPGEKQPNPGPLTSNGPASDEMAF